MTSTLPVESATETVPGFAVDHPHRWLRLVEERRFRTAQLADLEADEWDDPWDDSVRAVLRASARTALSEVEAALKRLEEGTYGWCVTCHRPLDTNRLDTLPMTPLCMSCHYQEQNHHVVGSANAARGR